MIRLDDWQLVGPAIQPSQGQKYLLARRTEETAAI